MQTICMDGQCLDDFKWKKNMLNFNEDFIKNYDEDSNKGHILEVDIDYPKELHDIHSNFPLLAERVNE